MNDENKRFLLTFIIISVFYICSIVFVIIMRYKDYAIAMTNPLYTEINKITKPYQMRQIIACIILFWGGYLIVAVILSEISDLLKMILALPTAIAVWGSISLIVLLLRIPYTKEVMLLTIGILLVILLYWHRKYLELKNLPKLIIKFLFVTSCLNIFSTGIIRYTVTSDTHYYIYTYGRLIAKEGKLAAESMGNLIETTGPMMAVMSSFAAFFGFETIQTIHFMLMVSFELIFIYSLYNILCRYNLKKKKVMSIIIVILSTAISPLFLMSNLILSHSWMMAFLFISCICMEKYLNEDYYDSRNKILCMISVFLSWMSLLRIEAVITVLFIAVCFSYLGLSQKELAKVSIPTLVLNVIFHLEMQYLIAKAGDELSYGTVFVTKKALAIIFLSIIAMGIYIILYNVKWVVVIRRNLPIIIIVMLLAVGIILCILDKDRAINNFSSIFYNLKSERWYYFPHLVSVLLIIILKNKRDYGYWDMIVFGMILLDFAMCMGRVQYLRNGWGDSFNRYLLQMVPFMLVFLTNSVGEIICKRKEAEESA